MTPTPNPTAESVIYETLIDNLKPWASTYLASLAGEIGEALRKALGDAATVALSPKAGKGLDPVKVAEVIRANQVWERPAPGGGSNFGYNTPEFIARAFCEAYTEGKLT